MKVVTAGGYGFTQHWIVNCDTKKKKDQLPSLMESNGKVKGLFKRHKV
jgi:hypothetical protein